MSNVIDFKNFKSDQSLKEIQDSIQQVLVQKGADDEIVNFALSRAEELFKKYADLGDYSVSLSLNADVPLSEQEKLYSQVNQLIKQVQDKLSKANSDLLIELLFAEIKLFQYRRDAESKI